MNMHVGEYPRINCMCNTSRRACCVASTKHEPCYLYNEINAILYKMHHYAYA